MKNKSEVLKYENKDVLKKLNEEYGIKGKEARDLFKDLLIFLFISSHGQCCIPSERIDKAWHTFILFTKEYQEFCMEHFGSFIHHRPGIWKKPGKNILHGKELHARAKKVFNGINHSNWIGTSAGSGTCCSNCESNNEPPKPLTAEEKRKKAIDDLKQKLQWKDESIKDQDRDIKELNKELVAARKEIARLNAIVNSAKNFHHALREAEKLLNS